MHSEYQAQLRAAFSMAEQGGGQRMNNDRRALRIEHCKKCGREIVNISHGPAGKYQCDPDQITYYRGGTMTVVTPNGELVPGMALDGAIKNAVGIGYRLHTCKKDEDA